MNQNNTRKTPTRTLQRAVEETIVVMMCMGFEVSENAHRVRSSGIIRTVFASTKRTVNRIRSAVDPTPTGHTVRATLLVTALIVALLAPAAVTGQSTASETDLLIDNDDSNPPLSQKLEPGKTYTFDFVIGYQLPDGETDTIELYLPDAGGLKATEQVTGTGDYTTTTITVEETVPEDTAGGTFGVSVLWKERSGGDDEAYQVKSGDNNPPTIDSHSPSDTTLEITEGDTIDFSVEASDPDGDSLSHTWHFDDLNDDTGFEQVGSGSGSTSSYSHTFDTPGDYAVEVRVSDGSATTDEQWTIGVSKENQNRAPAIKRIKPDSSSITVQEGDRREFEVEISDPDADLERVEWDRDGTTEQTHYLGSSSPQRSDWNHTFDEPGSHTIEAIVYDSNNNTASLDWSVTVEADINTPSVTTDGSSDVDTDSATLKGTLDGTGGASSVDVWFQYRKEGTSTWQTTSANSLNSTGSFRISASGLTSGTTYEYRAIAENSAGRDAGSIQKVTTSQAAASGTVDVIGDESHPSGGSQLEAGKTYDFGVRTYYEFSGSSSGTLELYFEGISNGAETRHTVSEGSDTVTVSKTKQIPDGYSGELQVSILLKDGNGDTLSADTVSYQVHSENNPPTIDSIAPSDITLEVPVGDTIAFSAGASDPDGDSLSYSWYSDDLGDSTGFERVATGTQYSRQFDQTGDYAIELRVTDGQSTTDRQWTIGVSRQETPTPTETVERPPPIVGDARPIDPDRDGIYEDTNGNGRLDFDDVVTFHEHRDTPAMTDHVNEYDLDRDGQLDKDDVVALSEEMYNGH